MSAFPFATFFIETSFGQCQEFLEGESGMHGIVCGAPVKSGSAYCPTCHAKNYLPSKKSTKFNIADYSVRKGDGPDDREIDLTELLS
jgi:hypothetical protein